MKKIPTLLVRDFDTPKRTVHLDRVTPGCEWVLTEPGVRATRKYDGTCVFVRYFKARTATDGHATLGRERAVFVRREVPKGKPYPAGFLTADYDGTTGKTVGWMPAHTSDFRKYLDEAIAAADVAGRDLPEGTYELCGPKINGNPEGYETHVLVSHADAEPAAVFYPGEMTLKNIIAAVRMNGELFGYEGIVFHGQGGKMAKLKARDLP